VRTFIGHKIRLIVKVKADAGAKADAKAKAKINTKSISKTIMAGIKLFRQVISCLPGFPCKRMSRAEHRGMGAKKVEEIY
jgi:hypothetical protein